MKYGGSVPKDHKLGTLLFYNNLFIDFLSEFSSTGTLIVSVLYFVAIFTWTSTINPPDFYFVSSPPPLLWKLNYCTRRKIVDELDIEIPLRNINVSNGISLESKESAFLVCHACWYAIRHHRRIFSSLSVMQISCQRKRISFLAFPGKAVIDDKVSPTPRTDVYIIASCLAVTEWICFVFSTKFNLNGFQLQTINENFWNINVTSTEFIM